MTAGAPSEAALAAAEAAVAARAAAAADGEGGGGAEEDAAAAAAIAAVRRAAEDAHAWGVGAGLPNLGAPTQLRLRAGDVVLAHAGLAHRAAPNAHSSRVRIMAYFRLKHVAHSPEAAGLWHGLDGLKRAGVVDDDAAETAGQEASCCRG